MSGKDIVETVYGKRYKYEIVRSKGMIGSVSFSIHRDGSHWKGSYDSLARAVEVANDAG
jgi:hypothetical protein